MTKSVTLEPRVGNSAPRLVESGNAMLNSVGLANPGLERVCSERLPWIREHLSDIQVFVSVAGHTPDEYWRIVEGLELVGGFLGYEVNLSCPNDIRLGGLPFALDPEALRGVVEGARRLTDRPLLVKLAPNVPDIGPRCRGSGGGGCGRTHPREHDAGLGHRHRVAQPRPRRGLGRLVPDRRCGP